MDFPKGEWFDWIDKPSKNTMVILILATFLLAFLVVFIINVHSSQKEITRLTKRVIIAENQLTEQKLQFETFKKLTSDEFESTWKSFAAVRGNFQALGHGFHLQDRDFMPEGETDYDTDGTSDSSNGEMQ